MHAGRLNTWVEFQQKVVTGDGGGGKEVTWPFQFRRKCNLRAIPASTADSSSDASRSTHAPDFRLTMRWDSKTKLIKSDWRVDIHGEILAIQSVGFPDLIQRTITLVIQAGQAT